MWLTPRSTAAAAVPSALTRWREALDLNSGGFFRSNLAELLVRKDHVLILFDFVDVIGARSAGLSSAWVQRSEEKIYDPWGVEPNVTVRSMIDLPAALQDHA